jgi:hypothetical protein
MNRFYSSKLSSAHLASPSWADEELAKYEAGSLRVDQTWTREHSQRAEAYQSREETREAWSEEIRADKREFFSWSTLINKEGKLDLLTVELKFPEGGHWVASISCTFPDIVGSSQKLSSKFFHERDWTKQIEFLWHENECVSHSKSNWKWCWPRDSTEKPRFDLVLSRFFSIYVWPPSKRVPSKYLQKVIIAGKYIQPFHPVITAGSRGSMPPRIQEANGRTTLWMKIEEVWPGYPLRTMK